MALSESVKRALDYDIGMELPVGSGEEAPSWLVLSLRDVASPVVALSRDSRVGRAVVPVFFVAVDRPDVLPDLAETISWWSSGKMPLWHVISGRATCGIAVFPFLFDRGDDPRGFVDVAVDLGNLIASTSFGSAFCVTGCCATITRDGFPRSSTDYEDFFV
jgi:hypothetical protein